MSRKRHWLILLALLVLSATVQVVIIRGAMVPAQDAVRFAAAAQSYGRDGFWESVAAEPEPPLFPLLARGTSILLDAGRALFFDNSPSAISWATKLQVAAAIPLVLCVVPVYLLALRWLGGRAALATAILFAVLKEPARLGADGISDSTHLLLAAIALWALSMFLIACPRPRQFAKVLSNNQWLAVCGTMIGLALLVRPESLLLLAVLIVLLPIIALHRSPVRRLWEAGGQTACLLGGLAVILLPYACLVGFESTGDFARRMAGRVPPRDGLTLNDASGVVADSTRIAADSMRFQSPAAETPPNVPTLPDGTRMRFVLKETTRRTRFHGILPAAAEYAGELSAVFQYWLAPFSLLAVWRARRAWRRPMNLFASTSFLLFSLAVVLYASRVGYLSGRHLLILLLLGLPWAGRGVLDASRLLRFWWLRTVQRFLTTAAGPSHFVFPVGLAMAAVICLASTLKPLHASRLGHRRAAEWLIHSDHGAGAVLDSRGWTGLYTDRHTYLCDAGWQAVADPQLAYIVVESWELELPSRRSRTLRQLVQTRARLVATFADPQNPGAAEVSVYRLDSPAIARRTGDRVGSDTR